MALDLSSIVPAAIGLVIASIAVGMGARVLTEIKTLDGVNKCYHYNSTGTNVSVLTRCVNSTGVWNTTSLGIDSMQSFATFVPTIAIVVIAAVVIGIVVYYFR